VFGALRHEAQAVLDNVTGSLHGSEGGQALQRQICHRGTSCEDGEGHEYGEAGRKFLFAARLVVDGIKDGDDGMA
jgi:hypothetical protein